MLKKIFFVYEKNGITWISEVVNSYSLAGLSLILFQNAIAFYQIRLN